MNIPLDAFIYIISGLGSIFTVYTLLDRRVTRLEEHRNISQERHTEVMKAIQRLDMKMDSHFNGIRTELTEVKLELENKEDRT